jgi:hypothetical protein
MTKPPEIRIRPSAAAGKHGGRPLLPARYRHPGDVIRLIVAGLVLAVAVAVTAVTHVTYAGARAAAVTAIVPSTLAGRALAGLVQALYARAAVAAVLVTVRFRRFRLLGGLAGAAVLAGAMLAGIIRLAGGEPAGPARSSRSGPSTSRMCPARRDLRPGARRGKVHGPDPAEPGLLRAGRSGADGLIPAGVECVE